MEPVRFRADEILYAQSTLTPNCAASCAKAPLPASYAPRSFCRRSLLYAFAISTTSTNAKRLQRISLYTFWKFALISRPPNQLLIRHPDHLVALAGRCLETWAVHNPHPAARVVDQPL